MIKIPIPNITDTAIMIMPAFESLRRSSGTPTQTTVAIERLRSEIICGKLRPGEKLRVQALAERYALAASALREALSRLVTDALVVAEDQRGFRVSSVSREGLIDLTEARIGIESLALGRAIELGDVKWESDLIGAYHRLSRCTETPALDSPDLLAWTASHADFHRALIAGCQSEWLLYFSALMYQQSERYRMLATYSLPVTDRNPLKEHEEIMQATLRRESAAASAMLAAHYRETTRLLLEADAASGGLAVPVDRAPKR